MAALSLAGLVLLVATTVALAVTGDLTQPAGDAGCLSNTGAECASGHGLLGARSVAVSPDGKSVYVAAQGTVARIDRDTTTGAITQPAGAAGCISEAGVGSCTVGHGLKRPNGVAVSPDGKSVYVAASGSGGSSGAVVRLNRNTTTGALTQPAGTAGCVSETGAGPCADGHGLRLPLGVAVSPDGKSVYVGAGGSSALARFNRNTTTGAITQPGGTAGCISETGAGPCANGHAVSPASVAVSTDGKSVYVTSQNSDAVARFNRSTTTGAITQPGGTAGCVSATGSGPCANGHGLQGVSEVAVSPDGKSVYVASFGNGGFSGAVARLNRDTTTGAITQPAGAAGCISETGAGPCANGRGLDFAYGVAVSPDAKSVYVASEDSDAVARFNRATTTGAIFQPAGAAGCVSQTGLGCALGRALSDADGVALSPDGKSVYVASRNSGNGAVAHFMRAP